MTKGGEAGGGGASMSAEDASLTEESARMDVAPSIKSNVLRPYKVLMSKGTFS